MSEIKCISYKEVSKLYKILKEIKLPYYTSRKLNIRALKETTLANLIFNYRLLVFVESDIADPNTVLFQLPSIDETSSIDVLMISKYDPSFIEKSVEYIKKEFKDFGWEKIIIEYMSQNGIDERRDREIKRLGFSKKITARCINENYSRNLASIIIREV